MIKFGNLFSMVMRFGKSFSLKKMISELLLIVVAVTLAFALENWRISRQGLETEQFLLKQIRSALITDLNNLNKLHVAFSSTQQKSRALQEHLSYNLPYVDSLDTYFGSVLGFWTFQFNRSAYEVLKAKGLH